MKVIITGGGTGGHVYPALAVAEVLHSGDIAGKNGNGRGKVPPSVVYLGAKTGVEAELATRAHVPFLGIQTGPLRSANPLRLLGGLARNVWGLFQAYAILRRERPGVVLATGGYVCTPVVLAAWLLRRPRVIYLPDVKPGWAIRALSPFATKVAVSSSASARFLPARKLVETGYPVRGDFGIATKREARERLGLEPGTKTLLVWGGSRGAHSINGAVCRALPELLGVCQIVHISGRADEPWLGAERSRLSDREQRRYHLYGYLHEQLPAAFAAADLAVSRAGASVLGEFPAAGLPSVLVPYPYAGAHQRFNAEVLQAQGAALILDNSRLDELAPLVTSLLEDEDRLARMAERARALARPDAAQRIALLLRQVARGNNGTAHAGGAA